MKKLVFGLVATVVFSYSGNTQNLRASFLEGKKTHKEVVDAYNNLSDTEQRNLWIEKFNQLLSLDLPIEHKDLLKKLSDSFYDGVSSDASEDFFKIAADLAKITPSKDFGYMFETLVDYEYNGGFIGNTSLSIEFINDVKNLNPYINLYPASLRGNCSCRWCLGHSEHTGTNCNPTDHGCGFLWMQSCNQCIICW